MPTLKGPCVLIDVGANVSPKASHLYAYGVMGSIFAKHIFQREKPTIGLMNVGSEVAKGNDLAKETFALFSAGPLKDCFVGNIEGRDIHRGACDVVVTEGFLGNVVLKVSEGLFDFTMKMVAHEVLHVLVLHVERHLRVVHVGLGVDPRHRGVAAQPAGGFRTGRAAGVVVERREAALADLIAERVGVVRVARSGAGERGGIDEDAELEFKVLTDFHRALPRNERLVVLLHLRHWTGGHHR